MEYYSEIAISEQNRKFVNTEKKWSEKSRFST